MDGRIGDRNIDAALLRSPGSPTLSPFVGRTDELRRLKATLTHAAEGQGSTIFLIGQPGIGKTRLALEALGLARERGFIVLQGRSYPSDVDLAYAPVLDAFGSLLRDLDFDHLAALVSGLPEVGRLFRGLRLPSPEVPDDAALEKTRLFESVARLIERLAREAPLALFMDDVHWADPATLQLLHYLARGLRSQRVLLLTTCTTEALNTSSGFGSLARSLLQPGLAQEIGVPRLASGPAENLVVSLLGGTAPAGLVSFMEARARGIPLFVEGLTAALLDSGSLARTEKGWVFEAERAIILPPSIRYLILDRLERLDPAERRVLDLMSALDDHASHAILCAASGLEEEALLDALRRLQAAELMAEEIEGADVSYILTQPLVGEVARAGLPEMLRRRARMAASREIKPSGSEQPNNPAGGYPVADPETGDCRPEAAVSAVGGEISGSTGGSDEPSPPLLLERLGEAWEGIGEEGAAVAVWNEALTERQRAGDAVAVARLRRLLARAEWDRGNFEIANAHLSGLDVVNRQGSAVDVANTTAELLSLARRSRSPRAEAEANLVAAISSLGQGDVDSARENARRALELGESFPEGQDLAICCRARISLMFIEMRLGDHRSMREHAERGLAMVELQGSHETKNIEVRLRARLAHALFMAGSWDEALRSLMEAITLARRIGHHRYLAHALAERAMILALQGEFAESEACIAEVRMVFDSRLPEDRQVYGLIDMAETVLALERGQADRALAIARSFTRPPTSWQAGPAGVTAASRPMALMLLAQAHVAAGDANSALEIAHTLIDLGPSGAPYLTALASRSEGLARQALGQLDVAISCLKRAHETFIALEMPFEAARCLLEQATTASREQPFVAASAGHLSLVAFERIGAHRYADRSRALLHGIGVAPPPARRIRHTGSPLSMRELEVARMVAEGLTNPEIAERLTLSPRTITSHLDHIYARLGIGSRAALARYVTEAGLLSPEHEST